MTCLFPIIGNSDTFFNPCLRLKHEKLIIIIPRRQSGVWGNIAVSRGNTPYDGLYGDAPPERGSFIRYETVGILLVEVYKRVRKYVFWVCERAQRAERMNFMDL